MVVLETVSTTQCSVRRELSGKVTDSNKSQTTAHHLNTDMSGQGSIEHEKHEVLSQI